MSRMPVIIGLLALIAAPVLAGEGGIVSPFELGSGARELSLGGTGVLTTDGGTAAYWNPSSLADVQYPTVTGFHSSLFTSGVAYQYFGAALPTLDFGSFGIGVFRLGVDGIEERDEYNLLLGEVSEQRLGIYAAYGQYVGDFRVGVSTHLEHHSLADRTATSTPGVSVGVGREVMSGHGWTPSLELSVVLRNVLQPGMKYLDETVTLPFHADIGSRMVVLPQGEDGQRAELAFGIGKTEGNDPYASVGLEYTFSDMLSLRGGRNGDDFSCGAGVHFRMFTFDYALVERDLGSMHMFSFSSAFGVSLEERRANREKQRETEFDELMTQRVSAQNETMIVELIRLGKAARESGQMQDAAASFDRALFLSRASGIDTTEVSRLAAEAHRQQDESRRQTRLAALLDSANTEYRRGNMIGTSFYASLALKDDPMWEAALDLNRKAEAALQETATRQETVRVQLFAIDSLVTFGHVDEAAALCRTLQQFAPGDPSVEMYAKRVRIESWRRQAEAAMAVGDLGLASSMADLVEQESPGHDWLQGFRKRVQRMAPKPSPVVAEAPVAARPTVSAGAKKAAEASYQSGQKAFADGRLEEAIANWEQVERLAPNYRSVRDYLFRAYKLTGIELYGKNRLSEAIQTWEKALRLEPGNAEISNYIARTRVEQMKLGEAGNE